MNTNTKSTIKMKIHIFKKKTFLIQDINDKILKVPNLNYYYYYYFLVIFVYHVIIFYSYISLKRETNTFSTILRGWLVKYSSFGW